MGDRTLGNFGAIRLPLLATDIIPVSTGDGITRETPLSSIFAFVQGLVDAAAAAQADAEAAQAEAEAAATAADGHAATAGDAAAAAGASATAAEGHAEDAAESAAQAQSRMYRTVSGETDTLQLTDLANGVIYTSSLPVVVTVPKDVFVTYGGDIELVAHGTGVVTVVAEDGSVTLRSPTGTYSTLAQYARINVMPVSSNLFDVGGMLALPPVPFEYDGPAPLYETAIGSLVQAYSAVLQATTASFLTAHADKLAHIAVTQAVDLDAIETRVNQLDAAVVLKGAWDASTGAFPSGGVLAGWSYHVSVAGTVDGVDFSVKDRLIALVNAPSTSVYAGNWLKADYSDLVTSVAGRTGAIVINAADIDDASANGRSLIQAANYAAMRTLLGLVIGTDVQAYSAVLAGIVGLSPSNDDFLQRKAGAWANRTLAQVLTDLQGTGASSTAAGFRGIPANTQSANYTAVMSDVGKRLLHPASDANNRTYTIDSLANVSWPDGAAISFDNRSVNDLTINVTTQTLYLGGTTTTGARTLKRNGFATAVFDSASSTWTITGAGLT